MPNCCCICCSGGTPQSIGADLYGFPTTYTNGTAPDVNTSYILTRLSGQAAWGYTTTQSGTINLPGCCVGGDCFFPLPVTFNLQVSVTCIKETDGKFYFDMSAFRTMAPADPLCEWIYTASGQAYPAHVWPFGQAGTSTGGIFWQSGEFLAPADCESFSHDDGIHMRAYSL